MTPDDFSRPDTPLTQPESGEGLTLGEMAASGSFGIWADRDDIQDSVDYAEKLRRQSERRYRFDEEG